MTKTRVIAALIMAPVAIAAILLLPTQWLAAAAAAVFLIGLWEWLKLAGVEDTLARTTLLLLNLVLMVLVVWDRDASLFLFRVAALVGVGCDGRSFSRGRGSGNRSRRRRRRKRGGRCARLRLLAGQADIAQLLGIELRFW